MYMQALVASGPNSFKVESIRAPEPTRDSVLVQVECCTICGSDVKLLAGTMKDIRFPLVPGHEWSGTVVGAGADVKHLIGRHVVSDILQSCGRCTNCQTQRPNLCLSLIEPGLSAQGAFAELIAVPARTVRVLPEAMPLDIACLVEPLSVALYAVDRQPVVPNDRVLILGGGGIGLLILQIVRLMGLERVALVDPHPRRREVAVALGATAVAPSCEAFEQESMAEFGGPPTMVYHAASRANAFAQAVRVVEAGGRIGVVGYTGDEAVEIRPSDVMVKLLDIRGVLSPTADLNRAIDLLANGHVRAEPLLTHDHPLDEFEAALDLIAGRRDGAIRVRVRPQSAS
ncbi:MAG TPA: alcohol dehydrogenase catalytic domain-containing protein [Propylenella sp.]|nr:alcohol dehydrogenase catalytic domain-containing protein [Propylenella sp.]